MKKLIIVLIISFLFIQPVKAKGVIDEKLLSDTLLTAIDPAISLAVADYYGYSKQYGLYDSTIKKIKRIEQGGYHFIVTIEVQTFEAAHNPPYGKETIKLDVNPLQIKSLSFKHKGDKEEKEVHKFYKKALSDIQKSFRLKLRSYNKYNSKQLHYFAEKNPENESLANIVAEIITKEITPNVTSPYKNVINPVTYIKGKHGYILFKKKDGTNIVYKVNNQAGQWKVESTESKQGKVMEQNLLWYM